ncbi:hypothetical protein EV178_002128 [Coemansia sp. RSA 1646]|nr:hypothetical protein EV178_002128 [Coemansia sp. RSA 1646]
MAIVSRTREYYNPTTITIHPSKIAKAPVTLPIPGISYSGIPGICSYICSVIKQVQHGKELSSESNQQLMWNNEDGHQAHSSILRISLALPFAAEFRPGPIQLCRLKIRYYDTIVELLARLAPTIYDLGITAISQFGILDVLSLGDVVPGIRSLSLSFVDDFARQLTGRNDHSSTIRFVSRKNLATRPLSQLSQLRINNYPHDVFDFLASLVRDQLLEYIYIETSTISTLERLDICAIGLRVRSFSLACIGNIHTPEEPAKEVISKVLSESAACIEYLRISVSLQYGVKLAPEPDLLLLPNLRSLSLRVPISLDRLTTVVAQMPHLRILKAPYISTTSIPRGAPQSIEDLWHQLRRSRLPAISSSIERVTFGFWDYQYNTRLLCCLILAFIARVPSVLTLVHDQGFTPTLKWTLHCLVMLAESFGGLFGQIPDHMHNLVITDHQGIIS